MKVMRKTRISVALAAALAGVGASTQVMAVNKSADDIGDAFIGPYYTVRGGWSTDFTVINTSNSTVPIKVRFHEANNSRDVLDFIVVLSPQDMIQAIVLADGPDGAPRLHFPAQGETSCVVPQPTGRPLNGSGGYLDFSKASYTGATNRDYPNTPENDATKGSILRASEGYFTIIEMGAAEPGAEEDPAMIVPYNSNHAHLDCAKVDAAFKDVGNHDAILKTYEEFGRNVNALKGSYSLTNVARGVQGTSEMVTLANFATEFSTLAPTLTWALWAQREVQAFQAAFNAAEDAADDAYDAVVAADNQIVNTFNCDSNLTGTYNKQLFPANFPDDDLAATVLGAPCDGAPTGGTNPPNPGSTAFRDTWQAAAANYNDKVDARTAAQDDLAAAVAQQLFGNRVANLIHAQNDPYFNYPNLDSGDLVSVNNWDGEYLKWTTYCDDGPLWDNRACDFYGVSFFGNFIRGVDAVTSLLMSSDLINEWAVNPVTGASSDYVVTFPTKRFYTDMAHVYPGIANYPALVITALRTIIGGVVGRTPQSMFGNLGIPPFAEEWDNFSSCDEVGYNVFNRDEGSPLPPGTVTSPQVTTDFCNEVNVLYFGSQSMLASEVAQQVSEAAPLGSNGWLGVDLTASFTTIDDSNTQWHPVLGFFYYPSFGPNERPFIEIPGFKQTGMPGVGFSFKERNLGQAASYGGISEHSYIREFDGVDFNFFDFWPFPPGEFGPDL